MDFEKVLEILVDEFNAKKIRYALIGGFAMGALGLMRSTMDLDFLVDSRDLPKIEGIIKRYDYKCIFKTENVSQYVSDSNLLGQIDFLHAFRKISLSMIQRSNEVPIFNGKFIIRVVRPEDVIGLKLQAMVNNQSRELREYADINDIMSYFEGKLDWDLIEEYFSLFEIGEKFKELKRKYGNIK